MNATSEKPANPDEYNGWTNRETWAFMLWLQNDEGLSRETDEWVADMRREEASIYNTNVKEFGEGIIDALFGELSMASGERFNLIQGAITDIGSAWRINWREVADHLNEWADA